MMTLYYDVSNIFAPFSALMMNAVCNVRNLWQVSTFSNYIITSVKSLRICQISTPTLYTENRTPNMTWVCHLNIFLFSIFVTVFFFLSQYTCLYVPNVEHFLVRQYSETHISIQFFSNRKSIRCAFTNLLPNTQHRTNRNWLKFHLPILAVLFCGMHCVHRACEKNPFLHQFDVL